MSGSASARVSSRRPALRGAGLVFGVLAVAVMAGGGRLIPAAMPGVAYRDGPPPGFTGGFGESACDACHFEEPLNDLAGTLTITGLPDQYAAGEMYPLVITLARAEMSLGGFQLATRFEDDGTQAGELEAPPDEGQRVEITTDQGIQYAYQFRAGSKPSSPDTARWVVRWTAPPSGRRVLFNVAANAADEDDSASGDFVYTVEASSEPIAP